MDANIKHDDHIVDQAKVKKDASSVVKRHISLIRQNIRKRQFETDDAKIRIKKLIRGLEFILLFFGVPLMIYSGALLKHPSLILLPILAGMMIYFIIKEDFNLKSLFHLKVPKEIIWKNIGLVLLTGVFLTGMVYLFTPENLFNLPRKSPETWLLLFILYPVFSAYSQEVIYRTFLFTRYKILFRNSYFLILISGITFGFMHIVYYHPLSMLLTLIAGIYLAWVYKRTRSVLFVAILHAILGNLVFTIGLGEYFWLNMESHL
jgi:uncharacterized protein